MSDTGSEAESDDTRPSYPTLMSREEQWAIGQKADELADRYIDLRDRVRAIDRGGADILSREAAVKLRDETLAKNKRLAGPLFERSDLIDKAIRGIAAYENNIIKEITSQVPTLPMRTRKVAFADMSSQWTFSSEVPERKIEEDAPDGSELTIEEVPEEYEPDNPTFVDVPTRQNESSNKEYEIAFRKKQEAFEKGKEAQGTEDEQAVSESNV